MRVRTSITLPDSMLKEMDEFNDYPKDRSLFIERAIKAYLAMKKRINRDRLDLERIDAAAEQLNYEAEDALLYQVDS